MDNKNIIKDINVGTERADEAWSFIEPDYEQLSGRETDVILAATLAKIKSAGSGMSEEQGEVMSAGADASANGENRIRAFGRGGEKSGRTFGRGGGKRRGKALGRGGRIGVVAIAVVLAFGIVAVASSAINPNSPLISWLDPGSKSGEIAQSIGTLIDKTVEKNGVKVHIKEAVGDKNSVYLLVDVTPPKDMAEQDYQYMFRNMDLILADKSSKNFGESWGYDSVAPDKDGVIHFIMSAENSGGIAGKDMTLELADLVRAGLGDDKNHGIRTRSINSESSATSDSAFGAYIIVDDKSDSSEQGGLVYSVGSNAGDEGSFNIVTTSEGVSASESGVTGEDLTTSESIAWLGGGKEPPAVEEGAVEEGVATEEPFEDVVKGEWKVSFKLDYEDRSISVDANKDVGADGDFSRLSNVTISPLSMNLSVENPKGLTSDTSDITEEEYMQMTDNGKKPLPPEIAAESIVPEPENNGIGDDKWSDVIIRMKDGTEYKVGDLTRYSDAIYSGYQRYVNITFDKMIDSDKIESLDFWGTEIKI